MTIRSVDDLERFVTRGRGWGGSGQKKRQEW